MLGLGILEAFLIWWRRWVQNKAVLEVETAMRHDLYERLQELPMSFHSEWQSGQLLSRATTDLSAIRRFFGFGLLFLLVNITQVVVTTLVLLHMYWPLGLVVAAASAPIALCCRWVREALRRGLPRRPDQQATRHAGRGGRGRHPRDQVVRPFRSRRPAVRRTRAAAARHQHDKVPPVGEVLTSSR